MYRKKSRNCNIFRVIQKKVQYFGDNCSLHGVGHVFTSEQTLLFKRVFWFVVLVCSATAAWYILRASLLLYSGSLISYSVETNYLKWDTPFPTVTVCEHLHSDRFTAYIKKNNISHAMSHFHEDVMYWHGKFCKTCATCRLNITCSDDILNIVNNYRLPCSQILTDCWWDDRRFSCCDRFLRFETEYGVCYSFNSRLTANESSIINLNRKTGLPSLVFLATTNINIMVHASDDMLSVASENVHSYVVPLVTDFEAVVKVEETVSDLSVQALPAEIRKCFLWSEKPYFAREWPATRYSYGACALHCRILAQIETCNCSHHLSPKLKDFPTCNIEGLNCLRMNKAFLANVACECPPVCEEVIYKIVHVFQHRHKELSEDLITRGSRGRVTLAHLATLRVRRHAIRDALGLVVDVGGVLGVFFGASLLSVVEIIYLLCVRRTD